ncbi:helix-turn-helix transcriptional regulator [Paraburkholderia sp. J94]|uniref:helix-turn-helix transcriptional regulator n=1 Tax=Paraburkholderia sp. J94 TaxID=2805441 RepID=UPI002AB1488D|nr:helix-turn-helix transcriptional regulator [Paraburkholderia sp. J94]
MPADAAADSLGSLIDAIYDAGLDARRWPVLFARIARRIGATHVNLSVLAAHEALPLDDWSGIERGFARRYAQHYGALDPLVPQARRWPTGTLVTDTMIRPQAAHARSEFVQDWVRPQRIHTVAFANVMREDGVAAILGALRQTPRYYDDDELDLLRALLPHLRNAIRVQRRMALSAQADPLAALDAFDALDSLAQCVLIADRDAHVVFANRAASALLAQPYGLREERQGLCAPTLDATQRLRAMIARASAGETGTRAGGAMLINRTAREAPLQVLIAPLGTHRAIEGATTATTVSRRGTAMLVITDPLAARRGVEQRLIALFGLTPAEARVAGEVGKGQEPRDIAATLQIMPSTVRTHLHHVFAKTATRRQADLMRLLEQIAMTRSD